MTESGRDPFSQLLYPMLSPQPGAGDALVLELARAPLEKSAESNRLRLELLDEFGDEIVSAAQRDGRGLSERRAVAGSWQRRQRHVGSGHGDRDARALRRWPSDSRALPHQRHRGGHRASATTWGSATSSFARSSPWDVPMTSCSPSRRAGTPRTSSAGSVKPGAGACTRSRSVGTTADGLPANRSPTTVSSFDPAVSTGFRRCR